MEHIPGPQTNHFLSNVYHVFTQFWYLLFPLLISVNYLRRRYLSPLRRFPGPFVASVSRIWKFQSTLSGHTHLDFIALHKKYGSIVRIAPNELSFASPEAARQVLSAGKGFHKTDFYKVFPPPENPDIFTEIREHVHAQKKRVANVPYSMASMQKLAPFIDDTIELFIQKFDVFADGAGKVDLGAWLHYFAFDVLGQVAFSRQFGFLEAGYDIENAIKTIDDSQRYNGSIGQIPELDYLLRQNPLRKLIPALSTKNALITKIALQEMDKRRPFKPRDKDRAEEDRTDLLGSLIDGHLKTPDRFTEGDVFAVAHGAIFAGSDSTASTMQSFFHYVLRNPATYLKIQNEILSAPLSYQVQWIEAQQLPYFQACLKEAMRLRPAVGLNITRLIPADGAEIDGTWLPGGTRVAVNGWVLHRNKDIFGEDVDNFRPERWLESEEKAKKMDRYMFQFGGGAHLCIGRNLALLEINKVIPRLIRDYEFQLIHPNRELKANATFFVVQEGLDVYIAKRKH